MSDDIQKNAIDTREAALALSDVLRQLEGRSIRISTFQGRYCAVRIEHEVRPMGARVPKLIAQRIIEDKEAARKEAEEAAKPKKRKPTKFSACQNQPRLFTEIVGSKTALGGIAA